MQSQAMTLILVVPGFVMDAEPLLFRPKGPKPLDSRFHMSGMNEVLISLLKPQGFEGLGRHLDGIPLSLYHKVKRFNLLPKEKSCLMPP